MPNDDALRQLAKEVHDLAALVRELVERPRKQEAPQPPPRRRIGPWDVMRTAAGVLGAAAAAGVVFALWQLSGLANDVRSHATQIDAVRAGLRQAPRLHVGRVVEARPGVLFVEAGGERAAFAPTGDAWVTIDGKAASLDDVKAGDLVSVYTNYDGRVLVVEARSE